MCDEVDDFVDCQAADDDSVVWRDPNYAFKPSSIAEIRANNTNRILERLQQQATYTHATPAAQPRTQRNTKQDDPIFCEHFVPRRSFPDNIVPKLSNVVASARLDCKINLRNAAQCLWNCEYDPRVRPGLLLRLRQPLSTCIVHTNGEMKVMGCANEYCARIAARMTARKIQKAALTNHGVVLQGVVRLRKFDIQSIVATAQVGFKIVSLEKLALVYEEEDVSYDPELASHAKICGEKVTLQVFGSGKITFLGAKSREDIYDAFCLWYPRLLQFRKKEEVSKPLECLVQCQVTPVVKANIQAKIQALPEDTTALKTSLESQAHLLPPHLRNLLFRSA